MQAQVNLPDYVTERLRTLAGQSGVEYRDLTSELMEVYNDPIIAQDPQLKEDTQRLSYSLIVIRSRYESRPPVYDMEVVPVGYEGLRVTKTGKKMSSLFVIKSEGNPPEFKLKRVVCMGDRPSEIYRKINLDHKYNVKLGKFSDEGDLVADGRSVFTNPAPMAITSQVLRSILRQQILPISQLPQYPSRVDKDEYLVQTDWRCIRGVIADENRGNRKDGVTEWGLYRFLDSSVPSEPEVDPETGRVNLPGLTGWMAVEMMTYPKESLCDVFGTVSLKKDDPGKFDFNVFRIFPIVLRR